MNTQKSLWELALQAMAPDPSQHLFTCPTAIASRAGSHNGSSRSQVHEHPKILVGDCPASDGVSPANIYSPDPPPSPAGLAPTGVRVDHKSMNTQKSLWELALQAMAPDPSQHLFTCPTAIASRAGSHNGSSRSQVHEHPKILVGDCPASDGVSPANIYSPDPPPSPAGLAPTGVRVDHKSMNTYAFV